MVEQAGAVSPSALEVEPPALRRDLGDAPALGGHDAGQERHRVGAVAGRDEALDVQEEPGLVGRGDLGLAPDRRGGEVGHAHAAGQGLQGALSDRVEHDLGVVVVGLGDHRGQEIVVMGGEVSVAYRWLVQVGDHEHGLDHARRPLVVVGPVAVEAVVGADRERDVAGPGVGVANGRQDVRAPELVERLAGAGDEAVACGGGGCGRGPAGQGECAEGRGEEGGHAGWGEPAPGHAWAFFRVRGI
ncbi:MAG TPA: hypothetical protein VJ741_12790 [Solirubrobacteraceae bacterium]|nr:hypothetical protein [Solirubrobacteraceae bacterium]